MAERSGLGARLAWLRDQAKLTPASSLPVRSESESGIDRAAVWESKDRPDRTEAGSVEGERLRRFGFQPAGSYTWCRETTLPNPLASTRPALLTRGERFELGRLLFLDTETTGLSGGAGNVAFLIGIGRAVGDEIRVRQLFMSDYPGEGELLDLAARELDADGILVTYNGASFDLPLLRTRFLMNGMRFVLPGGGIDLLRPARRLWGGLLESCSLHSIEESVLGVERDEDVPGFMVPELYFRFLRWGECEPLSGVFAHHLQDIVSLARLFAHIERLAAGACDGEAHSADRGEESVAVLRRPTVDRFALATMLLERGEQAGERLLGLLFDEGDERAGRAYGLLLKRARRYEEAREVWRRMWTVTKSRFAAVELAKDYEHRLRDFPAAFEVVESASRLPLRGFPGAAQARAELLVRRARLQRKLSRG